MTPCAISASVEHGIDKKQAEEMVQQLANLARLRATNTGMPIKSAMEAVAAEFKARDEFAAVAMERNAHMDILAQRDLIEYAKRFPTVGEGIDAKSVGSPKKIVGARDSVDYNIRSLNNKSIGELTDKLERDGVLRQFRRNELSREIYREMAELRDGGRPGISGSKEAATIARHIKDTYDELVARQNRAGAFIGQTPGYIGVQTHDMSKIRAAGESKADSFKAWSEFTLPKLDPEKTFLGADPSLWMRKVHEALYSGIHGVLGAEGKDTGGFGGNLAKKLSQERVLWFKDADSAYDYNQQFGTRDLRQQVITSIHSKARSIGLMEGFGPAGADNLLIAIRRLEEHARNSEDAAAQVDSINRNKIIAGYNQLTGQNDISSNPNASRVLGNIKTLAQMSKMGGVAITKIFGDKAFLQSEAMFQGIGLMQTLAKQVTTLAKRTKEEISTLRLMGVGLDGLMGNSLSRFSPIGPVSQGIDKAQRLFFDINFLSYVTDVHKMGMGELMAARLGEHSELPHGQLPEKLRDVLSLYDIGAEDWNRLRKLAWDKGDGTKFITPDKIDQLDMPQRDKDRLDTKLRTYFADRIDHAVPSPGAAERRMVTMDTKAGTPIGEAVRLMALFKSFPVTIANKVLRRDIYGNGSNTIGQWALNDHAGKFNMATLIAMTSVGGYLSLSIKDALNGKTPRPLITDEGKPNWDAINESVVHGGGMGLMGDMAMRDYKDGYSSFLQSAAGPVLGQLDDVAKMKTKLMHGEDASYETKKLLIDNAPLINLFYVRPILNYYVLWNLQEMLNPGAMHRMQMTAEKNHQHYFVSPEN